MFCAPRVVCPSCCVPIACVDVDVDVVIDVDVDVGIVVVVVVAAYICMSGLVT